MSKRGDTQIALTMEDVKNIAQYFEENGYETAYVGKWHLASESRVGRCIHTPKYLYSVYAPDKDGWKDKDSDYYEEDFLYDLEKDPYELHNLIYDKEYEDVRKQLAEELKEEMAKAGERCLLSVLHLTELKVSFLLPRGCFIISKGAIALI